MTNAIGLYDLSWDDECGTRCTSVVTAWTHSRAYDRAMEKLAQRKQANRPELVCRATGEVILSRNEIPF